MKRRLDEEHIVSFDTITLLNRYDTTPIATIFDLNGIEMKRVKEKKTNIGGPT